MKFKVTMKDPDTLHDAIREAVEEQIEASEIVDPDERDALQEVREEKINTICAKWFEYGEYLTIEIDTDTETATVCLVKP